MENDVNRVDYSVAILKRVMESEQQRVETGMALRTLIKDRVEKGLAVDHYRADWHHTSRVRLNAVLQTFAREFNEAHPKDKISNHDLIDLLTDTISQIVRLS